MMVETKSLGGTDAELRTAIFGALILHITIPEYFTPTDFADIDALLERWLELLPEMSRDVFVALSKIDMSLDNETLMEIAQAQFEWSLSRWYAADERDYPTLFPDLLWCAQSLGPVDKVDSQNR